MSALILNEVLSDVIISTYVDQKYFGTKESQEKYLKTVLKIREKYYLLKEKYAQTGVSEIDKIYLNWAERDLNSAVEFIQDLLKEA